MSVMSTCRKMALTGLLVYTGSLEGCLSGVLGPTLPQLQCLFSTNLQTISAIFLVVGIMNAVGAVIGSVLLAHVELHLLIATATTIAIVSHCAFPFVHNVYTAMVISSITAFCLGVLCNSRIFGADKIWPNQPFAVHLVIVGFGLGSIIASVVSEPFLEELPHNITTDPEDSHGCRNQAVRVQYLYLLLASYGVPVSVGMFVLYVYARQTDPLHSTLFEARSTGANSRRGYNLFLVFFFLLCMPAGGVFITYGDLLTTFGVNSNLHIRQRYMALITALFWGALVTGRIVMTIASIFIRQMWIIIVCSIGLFSASISLVFFANESQWSLAILSAVFGFFCAPSSAACFSLARERIQLTGFVVAVGTVGENVGAILGPYVGGLLMGTYSTDAFLYVVLSLVTILFILFCCIYTIGRYFLESNSCEGVHLLQATSSQSEEEATDNSDTF